MKLADDTREELLSGIFGRINEPVIPMSSIRKWLARFKEEDRDTALLLLNNIEFHSQPRVERDTRVLHRKLSARLTANGFDTATLSDVDFSREFTCKSGDIVSYLYRRSNLIPSIDFKTFDLLTRETLDNREYFNNRALVILDDYIGTSSQFIFSFIGSSDEDVRVLNSFRKIFLACYVIHEKALENFQLLKDGRIDEAITAEQQSFPSVDMSPQVDCFRRTLTSLDWDKLELVHLTEEKPLLAPESTTITSEEKARIFSLLTRYGHQGYSGTSHLLGHHTFFFGAPNSLPEILWPLFKRVEDLSIYPDQPEGIEDIITGYGIDEES